MNKNLVKGLLFSLTIFVLLLSGCGQNISPNAYDNMNNPISELVEENLADIIVPFQIDETTLIDDQFVTITATGTSSDSSYGPSITLSIANNTDKTIGIKCKDLAIDGYLISSLFECKAEGHSTVTSQLVLTDNKLIEAGLDTPQIIDAWFYVYAPDNYTALAEYPPVTIHTSNYEDSNYAKDLKESWPIIYDMDGILIRASYNKNVPTIGSGILLYIENNSDETTNVTCQGIRINGHSKSPIFNSVVYPSYSAVDGIAITDSWLKDNNISGNVTIELSLIFLDTDGNKTTDGTISFDCVI